MATYTRPQRNLEKELRAKIGYRAAGTILRTIGGKNAIKLVGKLLLLFTGLRGPRMRRAAQSVFSTNSVRKLAESTGYVVTQRGEVLPAPVKKQDSRASRAQEQANSASGQKSETRSGSKEKSGSSSKKDRSKADKQKTFESIFEQKRPGQPSEPGADNVDGGTDQSRPGIGSRFATDPDVEVRKPLSVGEEILTPQSSNVYSFSYIRRPGDKLGTLFVTFKAHVINPDAVSLGPGRLGGRTQLRGKLGRTVGGKTNEQGATYAYFKVPPSIYTKMKSAVSKGKFVWDHLRIRGSIYGHQYRHQLVGPQSTGMGAYIPRRASKKGFRVRSLADLGTGRRGYESSTLPESNYIRSVNSVRSI